MFKNLYEMTTEGNKLLFLTTKASVKERLRTEVDLFTISRNLVINNNF